MRRACGFVLAVPLFVLCAVVLARPAAAQQTAGIDYMNTGLATARDDGDLKFRLFRMGVSAAAPLLAARTDRLSFGLGYDLFLRDLRPASPLTVGGAEVPPGAAVDANRLEDELHRASASFLYGHAIGERWLVTLRAGTAFGGDWSYFSARGLVPLGAVGASVRLTDTFRLTFGAFSDRALEPFWVAPYLGWTWEPTDWFTSKASLPRALVFTFDYLDLLSFDVFARVESAEFLVAENDLDIDRYEYLQAQAGGGTGFRIVEDLWIAFQAGGTPYFLFEPQDRDGDAVLSGDFAPTWFARVQIERRSLPGKGKRPTSYEPAHPMENPGPANQ